MRKRKTSFAIQRLSGWASVRLKLALFIMACFNLPMTSEVIAQDQEKEKIQQLEQLNQLRQQQQSKALLDSAVSAMQAGDYQEAEQLFLSTLKTIKTVPSEVAYYFGENSFHLKKYRQSVDWLTKYIQLKGTTGTFSNQAVALLKRAEEGLLAEMKQQKSQVTEILSRDFDIDCGPSGKVVCPVCSGRTVIVRKNYLSETFTTCPYCDKHGFMSCSDYNKLLRGQLKAGTD